LPSGEGELTEDISKVLFNLASADRLTLLSEIGSRNQRLTTLSKVINASPQECSRHLSRLSDASLVRKNSEGLYEITPLGIAIQTLFPTFRFLLRYRDTFLSHDLSFLPRGFVERMGELSDISSPLVLHMFQSHSTSTRDRERSVATQNDQRDDRRGVGLD
jgi:predicted transcriptional regulator